MRKGEGTRAWKSPWSSFYVHRDDPFDSAPALCCIVSAAVYLGAVVNDEHVVHRILDRLDKSVDFFGTNERVVRALATAAGLHVWRPNKTVTLDDLAWRDERPGDETLWMVRLRARFADPKGRRPSYSGVHYVLVLDVDTKGVLVADPHPWNEPMRRMPRSELTEAWTATRGRRWAGCLSMWRG